MDQERLHLSELEEDLLRAYSVFGIDPLDGADELAFRFPKIPVSVLREKAERQLRDVLGRFRKMRAKIFGDTKAERAARQKRFEEADWAQPRLAPIDLLPKPAPEPEPEPEPEAPPSGLVPRPEPVKALTPIGQALWQDQQSLDVNQPKPSPAELERGAGFEELGYRPGHLLQHPSEERRRMAALIAEDVRKQYEAYKERTGSTISEEEYVGRAAEAIKERLLSGGPIQMRRKINRLGTLKEGSKNQFETSTSGGALAPKARRDHESAALMVDKDQPHHLRPSYGYLGKAVAEPGSEEGIGAEQYGSVVLTLKPAVEERTTVTPGDSLDIDAMNGVMLSDLRDGTASPGDIIAAAGSTFIEQQMNDVVEAGEMKDNASMTWGSISMPSPYMEAQIHGGLPLSDVQTITLDGRSLIAGRNSVSEANELFKDLSMITTDPMNPLAEPDPRKAFDVALDSVGFTMESFGEPGSPLRGAAERARDEILQMYRRGEIDSVGQAPQFRELLQQYFTEQGFDLEVAVNVDPPRQGDAAGARLAQRAAMLERQRSEKFQEDLQNYRWFLNIDRPVPERLAYIKPLVEKMEREREQERRRRSEQEAGDDLPPMVI